MSRAGGLLWGRMSAFGTVIALVALAADRLHKWLMLDHFGFVEGSHVVVTPFLDLVLVWNRGISYGLFQQDGGTGRLVLAGINVVASIALWLWLCRTESRLTAASRALVIGGALGNAYDRVAYGAVADFFHLHLGEWSWYVFNVADIAIVAGVAGLLYESFVDGHKSAQNEG